MDRFFLETSQWKDAQPRLHGREHHHCAHVMRHKASDEIKVFDGAGREAIATITQIDRNHVFLSLGETRRSAPLAVHLALAQAIPKGKQFELISQKATELGASEVFPLITERTVVKPGNPGEDAQKKREKWQIICTDAAKQCGQNYIPEVHLPVELTTFLKLIHRSTTDDPLRYDLMLIGSLEESARSLRDVIASFRQDRGFNPRRVLILIGPEGDFSPAEYQSTREAGYDPVTLGPIILRSETAAIYCLSVLSYELIS